MQVEIVKGLLATSQPRLDSLSHYINMNFSYCIMAHFIIKGVYLWIAEVLHYG